MSLDDLTFEIQLTDSEVSLGSYRLVSDPFPGMDVLINGQTYLVMERRHRYRFKMGRYTLSHILLLVKSVHNDEDKSWLDGHWGIGDMTCQFNARSPFLRCAIQADGPCRCPSFQSRESLQ